MSALPAAADRRRRTVRVLPVTKRTPRRRGVRRAPWSVSRPVRNIRRAVTVCARFRQRLVDPRPRIRARFQVLQAGAANGFAGSGECAHRRHAGLQCRTCSAGPPGMASAPVSSVQHRNQVVAVVAARPKRSRLRSAANSRPRPDRHPGSTPTPSTTTNSPWREIDGTPDRAARAPVGKRAVARLVAPDGGQAYAAV